MAADNPYRPSDSVATEPANSQQVVEAQYVKNEEAIRLLQSWLDDASGYDEQVWPALKEAIDEHRLSHRQRFAD